jgi:hypothetical protein
MHGSLETVRALIDLGADPSIADDGFNSTLSGWAEHFGHAEIRAYLEAFAR